MGKAKECPAGSEGGMSSVKSLFVAACVIGSMALALTAADAQAEEIRTLSPLTAECLDQVAVKFNHPRMALILILAQERGQVGKCTGPNDNGTYDCGAFQVNTGEIKGLSKVLNTPEPEVFRKVRDDGCFNATVAAYILAQKKRDAKGNMWDAMGRYNSATPGIKEKYQQKLIAQYHRLTKNVRRTAGNERG